MLRRAAAAVVVLLALAGCGRVNFRADPLDAGGVDGGGFDAGTSADGGSADAGGDAAVADRDAGPPSARSVTMAVGTVVRADCNPVELDIMGGGFTAGTTVTVTDSAGARFDAASVMVVTTELIRATVVLAGAAVGAADVTVTWPDATTLTATGALPIPASPFATAVFVDGDAPAAGADGTRAHPYATINAGIAPATARSAPVLVDGSATPYGDFALTSGATVQGCSWSAIGVRPQVAWRERHVIESGAIEVMVAGLDFMVTLAASSEGIVFSRGSSIEVSDCIVSGEASVPDATFVVFDGASDVEIVDSWLTRMHHTATPTGTRVLRAVGAYAVQGFEVHRTELSDIGFTASGTATGSELQGIRVGASPSAGSDPHDVRIHNVLAHDFFHKCSGNNDLVVLTFGNINSFDWVGRFELHHVTIDDLRHADTPATTTVTGGHVTGVYGGTVGGTRVWADNVVAHFAETDEPMMAGVSSYYGLWVDGLVTPGPSPQPMSNSVVFDVGTPLPAGANPTDWASGFANQVSAGPGTHTNSEGIDPGLDRTPGPTFYHPTNPIIATGGSDGGEMGAFGGTDGAWVPLSQRLP